MASGEPAGAREAPQARYLGAPFKANMVWAYDFVYDTTANGEQPKCLTVVGELTREGLAIDMAGSIRFKHIIEVLSRLVSRSWHCFFMPMAPSRKLHQSLS